MAVNTAIFFFQSMKITRLILSESDAEMAQREAVMDSPLYRGVRHKDLPPHEIMRLPIRQDRRPRDSTVQETVLFNAAFEAAHGVRDIRSKALFCSSDAKGTIEYANSDSITDESGSRGNIVHVYPLKSAKITYMKGINDSWKAIEQINGIFDKAGWPPEHFFTHEGATVTNHENSLGVVKFLLNSIKEPEAKQRAEQAWNAAVEFMKGYVIQPATALPTISFGEEEVIVFDSQYYYASALDIDEVLDLHDY